jgi:hypothetical protein
MQFTRLPPLCCAEGGADSAGLKPKAVMPDLIRHPEGFEFTGYATGVQVLRKSSTLLEMILIPWLSVFPCRKLQRMRLKRLVRQGSSGEFVLRMFLGKFDILSFFS